jgi:hypothetical protein
MFTFSFEVKGDVITFSDTRIAVIAKNYPEAIKKIKALRLPEFRSYDAIEEMLKLESVEEWEDSDEEDLEL